MRKLTVLHDTETFIDTHISGNAHCWPKKRYHANCSLSPNRGRLRVLILGRLVLDFVASLQVGLKELAEAIGNGTEKVRSHWTVRARVGGFAAWAARAAHRMNTRVWLSAVIPVPMPCLFEQFFEEVDIDTTYLTVYPGRVPASLELVAPDGHIMVSRNGVSGRAAPVVPAPVFRDFDVVLVNPGAPPVRQRILRNLRQAAVSKGRMPAVAICAGADWTGEDLTLVRDSGYFVFFNEGDAISTAKRLTGDVEMTVEQAASLISTSICRSRVVVTSGANGALMLNGRTQPHRTRATKVQGKDTTGAGAYLIAMTATKSAMGADDAESLDYGVAAVSAELAAR